MTERELHDAKIKAVAIRGLITEIKELATFLPPWNQQKVIEHVHAAGLWSADGFDALKVDAELNGLVE